MELLTDVLELRGLKNVSSKKGNIYYVLNCENTKDGTPYQFYCPNEKAFPEGLKKGDRVKIVVFYNNYKNLVVREVKKVV